MRAARGFILLEVMLAVAIFALAVIPLGKCVQECVRAQTLKEEDARARQFLAGREAEMEGGKRRVDESKSEDLKATEDRDSDEAPFAGMHLETKSKKIQLLDEHDQEIGSVFDVTLVLTWKSTGGSDQSKSVEFYVTPPST